MWPPLMNRFAKLNFFFSSWMPLKGVLAKLSYCSHERQASCANPQWESNGSPQGKSNNSPLCRFTKRNACHFYVSNQTRAVPPSVMVYCSSRTRHFIMLQKANEWVPFSSHSLEIEIQIKCHLQTNVSTGNQNRSVNAWHQAKYTVWHLEVIFSSSDAVSYKINLAVVTKKKEKKIHINPHHTNSRCCSRSTSNTLLETFIQAPPTQYNPPPNTHKHD